MQTQPTERQNADIFWPYKLFLIWCHWRWTGMSGGMFASHSLALFLSFFLLCQILTLTSSSPLSFSPLHTSQFLSVSHIYCLSLALPVLQRVHCSLLFLRSAQILFLPTWTFCLPPSLSPRLLYSLHFSFKHLLPLSFSHTRLYFSVRWKW